MSNNRNDGELSRFSTGSRPGIIPGRWPRAKGLDQKN